MIQCKENVVIWCIWTELCAALHTVGSLTGAQTSAFKVLCTFESGSWVLPEQGPFVDKSPTGQLCRPEDSTVPHSGLNPLVQLGLDLLQPLGLLQFLHLPTRIKVIFNLEDIRKKKSHLSTILVFVCLHWTFLLFTRTGTSLIVCSLSLKGDFL